MSERAGLVRHQRLRKECNRMSIVRRLCARPGLSRADLAVDLGLTKSTISQLARELIDEGWLLERDVVATGDLGRRPTPLYIDPRRLVLIGGELGVEGICVVVTSLVGEVLARIETAYGDARSEDACVALLSRSLLEAYGRLDPRHQRAIGIGVGVPGGVDSAHGFLHFAPNLQWHDVPVAEMLRSHLAGSRLARTPLYVVNEADAAAVGEHEFGADGVRGGPLLFVSINQGVGAGVIVGHELLSGSRGFAGEVGHLILQADGPPCSCGRRGCAEAFVGLRALLPPEKAGSAAQAIARLRAGLEAGDPRTLRDVERAGTYLGVLLQNLASAFDPACVVLGGVPIALGDDFLRPARRTLDRYAESARLRAPEVRTARHGRDAVAIGGAALARHRLTHLSMAQDARKNLESH